MVESGKTKADHSNIDVIPHFPQISKNLLAKHKLLNRMSVNDGRLIGKEQIIVKDVWLMKNGDIDFDLFFCFL